MKQMRTLLTIAVFSIIFSAPLAAGSGSSHIIEAIKLAQYASIAGKNGNANQLLSQAEESLIHTSEALSQSSDDNQSLPLSEAVRNLEQAIAYAKDNRPDESAQHVEQAIARLKEASR